MSQLFLFSIGPVQGFISQARKTMDLKAGSDILSQLILVGMMTARDAYQAKIIFPYLPESQQADSMPNKFLAKVDIEPDDAKRMGESIEAAVRAKFIALAELSLSNMNLKEPTQAFKERFFEQIETHLEVYWVFEELDRTGDYRRAYEAVEANLGAIKNIRYFTQLPDGESGRKCSVCGERDALIFSSAAKHLPAFVVGNKRVPLDDKASIDKYPIGLAVSDDVLLGQGEGLSAVVATKRFKTGRGFPSTADIALISFLTDVKALEGGEEVLGALEFWCKNKAGDGQLFFPENHTESYLVKQGYPSSLAKQVDKIKGSYRALMRFAEKHSIEKPKSYYAFLAFDGDRMGAIWAGDESYLKAGENLETFHQNLSNRLHCFASLAKAYLDDGRGQTVYAGGDDFTGFVNLHYLFEVLRKLRTMYYEEVHLQLKQFLADDIELSFSAGLCIAHYKTPLGEVVKSAHLAQDYAKDYGERNAFSVYLMKRSGEIQQTALSWGKQCENLNALATCTALMQAGCFSNTFLKVLNLSIMDLVGRGKGGANSFDRFYDIVKQEINRLVQQSKIDRGIKQYLAKSDRQYKTAEGVVLAMQKAVLLLFEFKEQYDVVNFLHALEIADFLNRQPDPHAN